MRRKPVTRSEIRFDGECITTLPVDAVREEMRKNVYGTFSPSFEPIRKLWAPLLRALNGASKRDYEQAVQSRKDTIVAGASFLARHDMEPWEPIRCPEPYRADAGPDTCRRCGRDFYRSNAGRRRNATFCSDACAAASRRER